MDLTERIARRRSNGGVDGLVADPDLLSPATHVPEPVGRGAELERMLDHLDPVFDGALPASVSIHGEAGVGKSALVSALFDELDAQLGRRNTAIGTTTRASRRTDVRFVYLDARNADSAFRVYHALLDALVEEQVPDRGVSAEALRDRLSALCSEHAAVVAVDHVGESGELTHHDVADLLAPFDDRVACWTISRDPHPEQEHRLRVDPIPSHGLVDVLTDRASKGLTGGGLEHGHARRIAEWADGDAHDALAALCCAAVAADRADADRIRERDVESAIEAVPRDGVHIARVLALPENRTRLLEELLALEVDRPTISEAAAAIAARTDLSESTITRFLYELSDDGILARVGEGGRSPSRLEPGFSETLFRHL